MKRDAVIVSAVRTAIGKQGGSLAEVPPHVLGAVVLKEALRRVNIYPELVDDVILGNVLSGGGNIARLTVLEAELGARVPGLTIDRQCGSGVNAINLAAQAIWADDGDIYIAGGTESMSRAPYLMSRPKKNEQPTFLKHQLSTEKVGDPPMGITAENLASKYKISREEQDKFSLESQMKAAKAIEEDKFKEQIVPIDIPIKRGVSTVFQVDEHPRPKTTLDKLSKLKPAFLENGTVTAGSSSGLNDAASAVVIMSREKAEELRIKPIAVIRAHAVSGVDPNIMGIGPVSAIRLALKKAGLSLEQIDLVEFNEAFAAQVLACDRELKMDMEKVNIHGGAIALGHPLGATGAILVTKAIYALQQTEGKYALITACIGGGQGIATIIERE